jgi:hypothetical protein
MRGRALQTALDLFLSLDFDNVDLARRRFHGSDCRGIKSLNRRFAVGLYSYDDVIAIIITVTGTVNEKTGVDASDSVMETLVATLPTE